MKNNLEYNFYFCLILLIIHGCCRDQRRDISGKQCELRPDEYSYFWLGEAKDYMYFRTGTWWVYKNTNTGLLDTISVISSSLDTSVIKGSEDHSYPGSIQMKVLKLPRKAVSLT